MSAPVLVVGTPVKFIVNHDTDMNDVIVDAGTTGVITEIIRDHGEIHVWVYLGTACEGLEEWHNRVELFGPAASTEQEFWEGVAEVVRQTGAADRQQLAKELAQEALNLAAKHIQDVLGIPSGDTAGVFFSDDLVFNELTEYALSEIADRAGE